ncbi:response regulator transcription factor [Paenibacillus sedimenti]|uniref:Response regulator n=1 Tax=Paenibacillus sedimenti TaxID=2770274 RepID=A0A926KV31_9BACL|nr:response regulator [Paenibacillus sedimenti]MBD0382763.1 response regulator [Paenibacillus sedimenti]
MNILIVDDEVHAVRGLQVGVDWEKLHIDSVQTAHSMKQAQEVYASSKVDLMICDIEMPQGTGMDLLGWVREHYPRTETIFLTCHSDFSYAKRAIQLGSFEYLLKPVDYGELEDVIRKVLAKINKDQQLLSFEETYKHYYRLWESHQPVMKERFWEDLIRQSIPSTPEKIREHLLKYDLMPLESKRFIVILIRVRRWYKSLSQRDERIMEYALRNAAEEKITQICEHAAILSPESGSLLIMMPSKSERQIRELREMCEEYIQSCNQYFYCDLCCYVGEPASLHEVVPMMNRLNGLDRDNVSRVNETILLREAKKAEFVITLPSMTVWAEWMKQGAKEKLLNEVKLLFQSLREAREGVDAPLLHSFYQSFLQMLFFVLQMKGLEANKVFAANLLTEKPESVLRSITALEDWVQYVIEVAMNQIHSTEGSMSVVDKVKQYVAAHISESDLSREDIAGYVFLNPDYLTRVFKKETGISISDYLQQQRIQYAKELLAGSDLPVIEVALSAGYSNLSYFSTIFKKAECMTPNEYRKQCGKY